MTASRGIGRGPCPTGAGPQPCLRLPRAPQPPAYKGSSAAGVADLFLHPLRGEIGVHPQARRAVGDRDIEQGLADLVGVIGHLFADRDDSRLNRGQPGREGAGIVLDQEGGEALMGAERGTVNDIDRLLGAVLADCN